ncbi:MAG TPA: ABC transporter substrate-binding protein [Candidatus Methylacidiphilales bacterium]|nr:ABC transporter substrate-binding protein [Candidatus Methylacidiphilales bacterium]
MATALRPLLLGLGLILLVSGIMLYGDRHNRNRQVVTQKRTTREVIPVALMQSVSSPVMDDSVRGLLRAMEERGYKDGGRIKLRHYNAEGSADTANSIALDMVGGSYKLLLTITTTSLQAVARNNKDRHVPHVFGVVSDPSISGVGVHKLPASGADKPAWLAGLGSMQPVEQIFRAARRINPGLKTVGVVWNPAEINSKVTVDLARAISKELGITLIDATIEGARDVQQAADSLVTRGAEAIWTGADAMVASALPVLTGVAQRSGIPVFSSTTGDIMRGSMFDLGANFEDVGYAMGQVASDVLDGKSTADMTIINYMPERVLINYKVWATLRDKDAWKFPDDFVAGAEIIVREDGSKEVRKLAGSKTPAGTPSSGTASSAPSKTAPSLPSAADREKAATALAAKLRPRKPAGPPVGKLWKIQIITLVEAPAIEHTHHGMVQGLADSGLVEGRDYTLSFSSAQGDFATLGNLLEMANTNADMIFTITTPALQTALKKIDTKPLIYALSLDPLLVGDTGTHENHRPNVAGVYDRSPFEEMLKLVKELRPGLRSIGTLYAPAESNSVNFREEFDKATKTAGLELMTLPVSSQSDVPLAAQSLIDKGPDLFIQINDNLNDSTWPAIAAAARRSQKPLLSFASGFTKEGAVMTVANDHFQGGWDAAQMAARVIRGENPAAIPYVGVSHTVVSLNLNTAKDLGLEIPASLLARADEVIGGETAMAQTPAAKTTAPAADVQKAPPVTLAPGGRPWRIFIMNYNDTVPAEETTAGILDGLKKSGYEEGKHFTHRTASGHGDLATMSALVDQAMKEDSDMIFTISTPSLQTALKRWPAHLPIVFGYTGNPMLAGAGKSYTDHRENATGISSISAFEEMCALLHEYFPQFKRIGTIYTPGEVNSVYYADEFEKAAKKHGIILERVGVNTAQELSDGANSLCGRGIDCVVQISDNVTSAGFASLSKAARVNKIPIFSFQSGQLKEGAILAYSRDFHDGGVEMGEMAARIFAGTSPRDIPFSNIRRTRIVIDMKNAEAAGVHIPDEVQKMAGEVKK